MEVLKTPTIPDLKIAMLRILIQIAPTPENPTESRGPAGNKLISDMGLRAQGLGWRAWDFGLG